MKSTVMRFYQQYFAATESVTGGWLARLTTKQRVQMLNDLMQWELNAPTSPASLAPLRRSRFSGPVPGQRKLVCPK